MPRLHALTLLLLCAASTRALALPSTFVDPANNGFLGGAIMLAYGLEHSELSLAFEASYTLPGRVGVGLTWFVTLPKFRLGSFSLDGLYFLDTDPTGFGAMVIPMKLRLGLFGQSFGAGFAIGLEYYAYSLYPSGDMFISPKFEFELDYDFNSVHPWIEAGASFEGTVGQPQSGGYVIYYYY